MSPTPDPLAARIAAGTSVLFGVCLFVTVASVNVPPDVSDASLVAWWQQSGNVTSGLVSMAFAVLTAVLFAVISNHLLTLAGDRSPRLTAFARTMSTAVTVTLLVSAALRGVIGHLTMVEDGPLPGIDVLRYTTALNYTMLGVAVMGSLGVAVLAIAALVLRLGLLPQWAGIVGVGCGVLVLAAVAAGIGAFAVPVAILWSLCTAVAVVRGPAPRSEPSSPSLGRAATSV